MSHVHRPTHPVNVIIELIVVRDLYLFIESGPLYTGEECSVMMNKTETKVNYCTRIK